MPTKICKCCKSYISCIYGQFHPDDDNHTCWSDNPFAREVFEDLQTLKTGLADLEARVNRMAIVGNEHVNLLKYHAEQLKVLEARLAEFDKYVLESRIHPLESRVAHLERQNPTCG